MNNNNISQSFFNRKAIDVAPELLGKYIVRKFDDGTTKEFMITEVEAYGGEDDLACHASKGKTPRNSVMYEKGGLIYVYLIYGMHWMLNFVTGEVNDPQAVLIRGIDIIIGPGKVSKALQLDKSFYAEDLIKSDRIWVEDRNINIKYKTAPRVGIDYAGEYWKNVPWRFMVTNW